MAPTFFKGREGKPLVEMDSISSFFSELLKGLEGDTTKTERVRGRIPQISFAMSSVAWRLPLLKS